MAEATVSTKPSVPVHRIASGLLLPSLFVRSPTAKAREPTAAREVAIALGETGMARSERDRRRQIGKDGGRLRRLPDHRSECPSKERLHTNKRMRVAEA